jgi:hypothetical protein
MVTSNWFINQFSSNLKQPEEFMMNALQDETYNFYLFPGTILSKES